MRDAGLRPSVVHESLLLRAIQTTQLALAEMEMAWVPVKRSWRLNERHYGDLQGLNKKQTADRYGEEQVKLWRRSYDVRPPELDPSDERHPSHDPRYATLPPELLPGAECLKDVVDRMLPYWYDSIVPDLLLHPCVLVSAHGNSLRALVKHLDGLGDQEVMELTSRPGFHASTSSMATCAPRPGATWAIRMRSRSAPRRCGRRPRARNLQPLKLVSPDTNQFKKGGPRRCLSSCRSFPTHSTPSSRTSKRGRWRSITTNTTPRTSPTPTPRWKSTPSWRGRPSKTSSGASTRCRRTSERWSATTRAATPTTRSSGRSWVLAAGAPP